MSYKAKPKIISVSRRTDIPAFHGAQFMQDLHARYAKYVHYFGLEGAILCMDARQCPANGKQLVISSGMFAQFGKLNEAAVNGQELPQYTEGDLTWMYPPG
jgi:hypothetical protein